MSTVPHARNGKSIGSSMPDTVSNGYMHAHNTQYTDDEHAKLDTEDHIPTLLPGKERFPQYSALGYRLFDANENMVLSSAEREEMKRLAELKIQELFDILRIDRNDPNSRDTPRRLARMWVDELFRGRYEAPPQCTVFPNRRGVHELVISKGIAVMSVCSHHWQTIAGTCAIGYIPGDYVIGLSKITRIVDWFARRGQIQEELGEQIAEYLYQLLQPEAVIVTITSRHYCMIARGVSSEEDKAYMTTTAMRGSIVHKEALRNEFFTLIASSSR
ncbi:MAG: GTP cyclohydrolase I [Bacteroidota bacterium]|nr:GTP cyclohydrolase I [Candidatus Kapabacteria bacterium]MDW8219324.1 GTP cyclohydrolase I [Bacteroidota bacterium]